MFINIGPHIFHTNNKDVWDFVNSLVPFNNFILNIIANFNGKLYNLPFNMNTFYQMWGLTKPYEVINKINEQKLLLNNREPLNLEEQALSIVGTDIYNTLIKEYTEKQWNCDCKKLPSFIIKRLPLRFTFNNNYFNDLYQGIPIGGYNKLIDKLLENVDCITNVDFFDSEYYNWKNYANKLVYTGQLDKFFNYKYGKLNWRSLKFETEILDIPNYQGSAIVNYTSKNVDFTRIVEHKHFELFNDYVYDLKKTVITKEYPVNYKIDLEPFYPINDFINNSIAEKYMDLVKKEENIIFGGRLAEYKYYDMSPIIEKIMNMEI